MMVKQCNTAPGPAAPGKRLASPGGDPGILEPRSQAGHLKVNDPRSSASQWGGSAKLDASEPRGQSERRAGKAPAPAPRPRHWRRTADARRGAEQSGDWKAEKKGA